LEILHWQLVEVNIMGWVQLNVGLVRSHSGSAINHARKLFDQIEPLAVKWRADGWLDCYFLMRKPPDVRLRFYSIDRASILQSALSNTMEMLLVRGIISEFFFSDYQPEMIRFGGIEAMKIVHDYFDLDTHNWIALDRLTCQNQRKIDPDLLLPSLFQDLFDRVLGSEISVLKTWHHLAALTPLSESVENLHLIDLISFDRLFLIPEITTTETSILHTYISAHEKLATELSTLWQADLLLADLYEILATIALFSFNRHGFPGHLSAPLVAAVLANSSIA
jgi:thiopeptide-type bacteriocin biosynthesis protein